MKQQIALLTGAIFGGLSVALGAFGAHVWKSMLEANGRLETLEVAVRYQMVHSLALLIAGLLMTQAENKLYLQRASACWTVGIVLFSGSLYGLSFSSMKAVAWLTPFGGLFFLIGWSFLTVSILKNK